jgi:hypothetical protein
MAANKRGVIVRQGSLLFAAVVALSLAGCNQVGNLPFQRAAVGPAPSAAPTNVASRADALEAARQCGRTLGIAARCNLVRDDRDFAVLRYAVLDGLNSRYGAVVSNDEMTELVDLATLDRLTSIGQCSLPPQEKARLEQGVRHAVASCVQP